jgi:hypothetical protein
MARAKRKATTKAKRKAAPQEPETRRCSFWPGHAVRIEPKLALAILDECLDVLGALAWCIREADEGSQAAVMMLEGEVSWLARACADVLMHGGRITFEPYCTAEDIDNPEWPGHVGVLAEVLGAGAEGAHYGSGEEHGFRVVHIVLRRFLEARSAAEVAA